MSAALLRGASDGMFPEFVSVGSILADEADCAHGTLVSSLELTCPWAKIRSFR